MKKGVLFAVVLLSISILASSVLGVTFYSSKTLATDLNEGVVLSGNNLYLDCAGHKIAGAGSGNGVYVHGQSGITIKNCDITGFAIGILSVWGDNVTISSSTVRNSSYGIVLDSTDNSLISSSTINNNEHWGIELKSGTDNLRYNVFDSNIIKNNKWAGIYFGDAPGKTYNNITRNTILNNSEGIYLAAGSNNNIIKENKIIKNTRGIKMQGAVGQNEISSNIIRYNTYGLDMLQEVGMYISWPTNNLFYNNLFNNPRNIYHDESSGTKWNLNAVDCTRGANIMDGRCWGGNFWNDYTGVEVGTENYGIGDTLAPYHGDYFPLIGVDCGSSITQSTALSRDLAECKNGLNITADNVVLDCNGHSITGDKTGTGIYAKYVKNVIVKNCDIKLFTNGIYFYASNFTTTMSNTADNNSLGIRVESGYNNTITRNSASNSPNNLGIYEAYGSNNVISDNTANNNPNLGIAVTGGFHNTIIGNTVKNNYYGLSINTENSTVTRNRAEGNGGYGIVTSIVSSKNLVYNNYFNNSKNVFDESAFGNYWNTSIVSGTNIVGGAKIGGNYWSDYAGVDSIGGDKIGDTLLPYKSNGKIFIGGDYAPLVFVSGTCVGVICSTYNTEQSCRVDCCRWNVSISNPLQGNCISKEEGIITYCDYDGKVDFDKGEQCDPGCDPTKGPCPNGAKSANFSNQLGNQVTCESLGQPAGTMSCTQECMYNLASCNWFCQQGQTTSLWTDTQQSSKDNCLRTFDGVDKTCCPNDQTCYNVLDTSTNNDINTCVKSGIVRCGGLNGYQNEEDCTNFNPAIAEASVEEIPNTGVTCETTCGPGLPCNFTRCLCIWDNNECAPGAEEVTIDTDNKIIPGNQCRYSITEGTCNRGIKTITYKATATGPIQGLECADRLAEVSCFAATEIPFFNFWSLMVTVTGIIVFYAVRRK